MKRQIDILLTTHNGQLTLPLMMEALARLQAPGRPWRLLVVDNASTDQTGEILKAWSDRLPIEPLFCAKPGKLAAQASALHHLEGDLVILTDDDILPDAGWLVALETAADQNPGAGVFGGCIDLFPIEALEPWFEASLGFAADLFSRTTGLAGPVRGSDHIFGPNMMLRRAFVEDAVSGAGPLGPTFVQRSGKRIFALGDESEMIARLERRGVVSIFVPEARVKHMVRRFQTRLEFMLQRAQNHGRGVSLRALDGRRALGGRAWMAWSSLLKVLWLWPRTWRVNRSVPDPEAFASLYGLNWHAGRVKGAVFGPFSGADKSRR